MSDQLLIIAAVFIEMAIPTILIALIFKYKKGRHYTVVQLGAVTPWLIFYVAGTVFYFIAPDASKINLSFFFIMSFIFYCLSFVIGFFVSLMPYPRNLKIRFLMGLTSPFLVYGFRELLIRVG